MKSLGGRRVWNAMLVWMLSLTALVPLIYGEKLLYPFIVPKVLLFRTLVAISFGIFVVLFATGKISFNRLLLKKKLVWLPGLFLLAGYFSSFFGIDFTKSFWSEYSRSEGLLTLTHLVVYFYLLIFVFTEREWNRFLFLISWASIAVAFSGIVEYFGLVAFDPFSGKIRIGGVINNAAFLASYLLLTAPVILYCALLSKARGKISLYYVLLLGTVISVFVIFLTETRGATIGFLGALFFTALLGIKYAPSKKLRQYLLGFLVLLMIMGIGGAVFKDTLKKSSIGIVARLASISLDDETTQSRIFIWKETFPEVLKSPILGHGFETFEYLYNEHYDPSVIDEEWFDRSHNVYIDRLLDGGMVGFLLYMGILVSFLFYLWQEKEKDKKTFFIFCFLLVAYVIQNFFVFDSINTLFIFYALLSWWTFKMYGKEKTPWTPTQNNIVQITFFFIATASIVSLYFFEYKPLRANLLLYEGYSYQVVDVDRSLAAWRKGIQIAPAYGREFAYQAYDSYFNKIAEKVSDDELATSYKYSLELFSEQIKKAPHNARLYVYLAHILEERPKGVALDDGLFFETINKLIALSPKRKQSHYILANYYLSQIRHVPYELAEKKNFEKGVETLVSYAQQMPTFAEPRLILANLLLRNNEKSRAVAFFEEGIRIYKPNPEDARKIVQYYLPQKNYREVEPHLKYLTEADPKDADLLFDLAHIYYLNGKVDEARDAVRKINMLNKAILDKDPAFVQTLFPNGITN